MLFALWFLLGCAAEVVPGQDRAEAKCLSARASIDAAFEWCEQPARSHPVDCSRVVRFSFDDAGCRRDLAAIDCNVLYHVDRNSPEYPASCRMTYAVLP